MWSRECLSGFMLNGFDARNHMATCAIRSNEYHNMSETIIMQSAGFCVWKWLHCHQANVRGIASKRGRTVRYWEWMNWKEPTITENGDGCALTYTYMHAQLHAHKNLANFAKVYIVKKQKSFYACKVKEKNCKERRWKNNIEQIMLELHDYIIHICAVSLLFLPFPRRSASHDCK